MLDFYCSTWDDEAYKVEKGPHGKLQEIIISDGYFVAPEISANMPNNQRVSQLDLEGVSFTVDVSGDTITEDDVTSNAKRYLQKFPNVYVGVANYVENIKHVPAESFLCPHCNNFVAGDL